MQSIETFQDGFARGVVTATDSTLLKTPASPKAWNAALAFTGAGSPYVQTRQGCTLINTTQIPNQTGGQDPPAIIGQYDYYRLANSTRYHLAFTSDGALHKNVSGTITELADTLGTGYPDFETAFDLCYLTSGTVQKKFNGTDVQKWGITRPTVGTMSAAAGAAGSPSGTYELRCTFVNSTTGHESSASDTATATVTVTNQKLSWSNIPTTSDTQVDKVYLYVRNTATMPVFFKVGEVNEGTTTATTDTLDSSLLTLAPDTAENDPPPSDIKYCCWHQGRMFVASEDTLYWSQIGKPEAFDPEAYDLVNSADGQAIKGLHSDQEVLLIFKEDKTYALYGTDPDSWEVRLIDAETGCGSHRTILSANRATWWWSRHGLSRYQGGQIDPIGMRLMGDADTITNYSAIARASAAYSESQHRLLIALPAPAESSRANVLIPINVDLGVMESDRWDPMDAASLGAVVDSGGTTQIILGGYKGQLFTTWSDTSDGVPSGTQVGTFVATATTASTLTDATASFYTTGGALIERKVTVIDSDGTLITTGHRPYITANTGTALTLSAAVENLRVGSTYTFLVGGPAFQWHSPWLASNEPWIKKRYQHLFTVTDGYLGGLGTAFDVAFDYDEPFSQPRTLTFSTAASGWGFGLWGTMLWSSATVAQQRHAVGRVGMVARLRFRAVQPDQPVSLYKVGLACQFQTQKR